MSERVQQVSYELALTHAIGRVGGITALGAEDDSATNATQRHTFGCNDVCRNLLKRNLYQ